MWACADGTHLLCAQELEETRKEAAAVVELLDLRQGGLAQTLDGNFPDLRNSVWQSESTVQAAVQVSLSLKPLFSHHSSSLSMRLV